MDDLVARLAVFALVGLGAGYASGLFGVGGGIVRIPVFIYLLPLFGVAHPVLMHMSIGTSISLVIPTSIAATWRQYQAGNLDSITAGPGPSASRWAFWRGFSSFRTARPKI